MLIFRDLKRHTQEQIEMRRNAIDKLRKQAIHNPKNKENDYELAELANQEEIYEREIAVLKDQLDKINKIVYFEDLMHG